MLKNTQPIQEAIDASSANINSTSGVLRYSVVYFLIVMVLMFVAAPLIEHFRNGDLIEAVIMTLVLLSAVLAVGGQRRTLAWAIILVMPAVAGKWVNHWRPDLIPSEVFLVAGLLFVLFIVSHLLRFILRMPRVNFEILCAGIATYMMLALLWSLAYILTERLIPNSFSFNAGPDSSHSMSRFNSLYFSSMTLSGASFGDIIPVSGTARMLAMLEGMTGMFYIAILISRLVALYSSENMFDDMRSHFRFSNSKTKKTDE